VTRRFKYVGYNRVLILLVSVLFLISCRCAYHITNILEMLIVWEYATHMKGLRNLNDYHIVAAPKALPGCHTRMYVYLILPIQTT